MRDLLVGLYSLVQNLGGVLRASHTGANVFSAEIQVFLGPKNRRGVSFVTSIQSLPEELGQKSALLA